MSTAESDAAASMRIDPARAKVLAENLEQVIKRVDAVRGSRRIRIIAVSKLKPAPDILALHQQCQHADFGENYSDELIAKSQLLPRSIRWHMIGGLQTNKCKPLASQVPNLWCVSSVDTAKKADELEKGRRALVERTSSLAEGEGEGEEKKKLRVLVQINTSHEASKSGVDPVTASAVEGDGGGGGEDAATALCRHIQEKCPHLRLAGLMTIGAIARSQASAAAENEDFVTLRETRDRVVAQLGLDQKEEAEEKLELSMGMSSDFEAAIGAGSDEVRVGTGIFGERPARKDATIM